MGHTKRKSEVQASYGANGKNSGRWPGNKRLKKGQKGNGPTETVSLRVERDGKRWTRHQKYARGAGPVCEH